jgi:hypothetical protein
VTDVFNNARPQVVACLKHWLKALTIRKFAHKSMGKYALNNPTLASRYLCALLIFRVFFDGSKVFAT